MILQLGSILGAALIPLSSPHAGTGDREADEPPSLPTVDQEVAQAAVRAGSFPGSFQVPGTDLSIELGGRVKLDGIHDFDAIGSTDEFKTSTIQVPEVDSDGNTTFHAKDTRLHMEVRSPSSLGEIRGYVEGNFFGSGDSFELRHAYLQTDRLLAGQTWTHFMLIDSRPDTLDFEGPDGSVFLRQAQLRWTQPAGKNLHWSVALEDPGSDITAPAGAVPEQVYPDLTAGWGASLSGRLDTSGKENFRYQITYGQGIARYIEDLRGLGLDAAPDAGGDLEALPTFGSFLAYQHFWSAKLRSSAVFSTTGVDNSAGQAASALKQTRYAAVNLIWTAAERLDMGIEYLYGTRENNDGLDAAANRVQVSVIYSFYAPAHGRRVQAARANA